MTIFYNKLSNPSNQNKKGLNFFRRKHTEAASRVRDGARP